MQRFVDQELLASDSDDSCQIGVHQGIQCSKQCFPAFIPNFDQFSPSDFRTPVKFRIAIPPRLFTIGGKEIGEPRFEISRDVRQDHGYRIRFAGSLLAELIVSSLFESALSQVLIAAPFAFN